MRPGPKLPPDLQCRPWLALAAGLAATACGSRSFLGMEPPTDSGATEAPSTPMDSGTTDVVPTPTSNPFRPGDHWIGKYTCQQGLTQLDLQIVSVNGNTIDDATFAFDWTSGATMGSYHMSGTFDPTALSATFTPGAWISRPSGWISVGMQGTVDLATLTYAGAITYPTCGKFSVTRTP